MLRPTLKRRLGLALAFALAVALMLPMTVFGQEDPNKPKSHSESHTSVYCSTTIYGANGKVTERGCSENTSATNTSTTKVPEPPEAELNFDSGSMASTFESEMREMMKELFNES